MESAASELSAPVAGEPISKNALKRELKNKQREEERKRKEEEKAKQVSTGVVAELKALSRDLQTWIVSLTARRQQVDALIVQLRASSGPPAGVDAGTGGSDHGDTEELDSEA